MKKIKIKKEYWCIITARRNSKSIKRKNISKVKGKELIKYSFDEIKKINKYLSKTIVTTDDFKIKKMCKEYNFEVIDREKKLAGDLVNSVDVVLDVLTKSLEKHGYLPEIFFLIQPTSIFLKSEHIKKLIDIFRRKKIYNSAQTIIKVPHQFHAYNQRYLNKNKTGFVFEKERLKMHNKQTKPIFFAYGNLIACKTEKFIKDKNFFVKPSFGYPLHNIYGFDVDNKFDLKIANKILDRNISKYEKN